jgi:alkylation response protein AidB-like acyl-CoA dehydrogenase
MNFELPEELIDLKKSIREFVEGELIPIGQQVDEEDKIPDSVLNQMKELGYFGLPFPEEYGGVWAIWAIAWRWRNWAALMQLMAILSGRIPRFRAVRF